MTQPTASITVELDKAAYAPGETMTATVQYTVPADSVVELSGTLRFLGGEISSQPTTVQVAELLLTDDNNEREWALVSNDGATAVFTATA